MYLSGPNEHIYTHNEMSFVFNLGLITPLHTVVYTCFFPLIFKISLILMIMQMKYFHIGPLDERTYQIVSLIILKLATIVV